MGAMLPSQSTSVGWIDRLDTNKAMHTFGFSDLRVEQSAVYDRGGKTLGRLERLISTHTTQC